MIQQSNILRGSVQENPRKIQVGDPQKTPVFEDRRYRKDAPFLGVISQSKVRD